MIESLERVREKGSVDRLVVKEIRQVVRQVGGSDCDVGILKNYTKPYEKIEIDCYGYDVSERVADAIFEKFDVSMNHYEYVGGPRKLYRIGFIVWGRYENQPILDR